MGHFPEQSSGIPISATTRVLRNSVSQKLLITIFRNRVPEYQFPQQHGYCETLSRKNYQSSFSGTEFRNINFRNNTDIANLCFAQTTNYHFPEQSSGIPISATTRVLRNSVSQKLSIIIFRNRVPAYQFPQKHGSLRKRVPEYHCRNKTFP